MHSMDPVTMMVASIGMQFLNNYANNKKNAEIQEKQREFQRAAAEHDFERMRKLQAESAKLALELETEVHKERVEDINSNYDTLLDNFAHNFTIQNWPLNVLPFVMKGESFGSLFNGTTQSVNMHCILTPSNCEWFNKNFYDDIDLQLEAEMNNNWNTQTTHPVVYYGGAWNRRAINKDISIPAPPNIIDLDDIELLRIKLKDVPVVVITPYFDPWLHFKVNLWGMGKDSKVPYRIDIPHGNDIKYSQRIFSYDYHKDNTELADDFVNTTIEEFVPYLECLIGFIADKYFWSMYHIVPLTPTYIAKKHLCFFSDDIRKLYLSEIESKQQGVITDNLYDIERKLDYIESVAVLLDKEKRQMLESELLSSAKSLIALWDNRISTVSELKGYIKGQEITNITDSIKQLQDIDSLEYKEVEADYLDLSEYANKFKLYIDKNADRFDTNTISLYIRHQTYNKFDIHIYDMRNKCFIIKNDGFDYKISARQVKNVFNIKSIFKNKADGYILCRYNRIEKLIEELNNTNILIY